jgi:hypothetical protein
MHVSMLKDKLNNTASGIPHFIPFIPNAGKYIAREKNVSVGNLAFVQFIFNQPFGFKYTSIDFSLLLDPSLATNPSSKSH